MHFCFKTTSDQGIRFQINIKTPRDQKIKINHHRHDRTIQKKDFHGNMETLELINYHLKEEVNPFDILEEIKKLRANNHKTNFVTLNKKKTCIWQQQKHVLN